MSLRSKAIMFMFSGNLDVVAFDSVLERYESKLILLKSKNLQKPVFGASLDAQSIFFHR